MSRTTIVQILRSPEGGIRKHVVDILENLPAPSYKKIFISNFSDSDRDLAYLKSKFDVEFFDLKIIDKPEFKDLLNIYKIFKFLRNTKSLVLHGHGAKGGVYARICGVLLRAPALYTPHGGSLHRVFGKLKSLVYDTIERLLIPLTSKFIFESKYSANEFKKYVGNCGDKAVINYNGVAFNLEPKQTQYQPGQKIKLASFGLLRELKGHDIVIDALNILSKDNIDFHYTIYGYGAEYDNLMAKIKNYSLQDKVTIEKYSDNIFARMLECDVVLHPSRFESFGYVPVEAMSIKVPVITSFEGGLKEVSVPNGSFLAKNNTPEEYALIIRGIVTGEYDLTAQTDLAFEACKAKFSVKAMVERLDSIYSGLNL
tara:strand:+ start:22188 stop:23297 length:1110 start_codon:yes stop_codon:yes gene_type:complete